MIRDLMGILMFVSSGALAFITYYLVRTGLRAQGVRFWPLTAMPTSMKLAGVFANMGAMLALFGYLTMAGDRPIQWWVVALVVSMAFWSWLLWWDFAHPSEPVEDTDGGR